MQIPLSFALATLVFASACGPDQSSRVVFGAAESPVVYGTDDRHQVHEEADPQIRTLAAALDVALVSDAIDVESGELRAGSAGETWGLCDDEPFASEPSVADCSGVLVAPDVVLTAGHCLRVRPCENWTVLHGFFYEAPGVLETPRGDSIARCAEVLALKDGSSDEPAADFAWIRLDRSLHVPTPGDAWLEARPISSGTALVVIGHGLGVPTKIDTGALVVDPRDAEADYFTVDADNFVGGSGSGVFDASGHLLGIAVDGAADFEMASRDCWSTRRLESGTGGERVVRFQHTLEHLCAEARETISLCSPLEEGRGSDSACSMGRGHSPEGARTVVWFLLVLAARCRRCGRGSAGH
jgi:hypothetical protein